jgi:hypothetical protein
VVCPGLDVRIGWLAARQLLILSDDPVRSLTRSVHAFCGRGAEAVANVADALTGAHPLNGEAGAAAAGSGSSVPETLAGAVKRVGI